MRDCVVLLAHLVLPALTRFYVDVQIDSSKYGSVNHLIQCVVQKAYGPQDTEALQSLFIRVTKSELASLHGPCPGRIPMMGCVIQLTRLPLHAWNLVSYGGTGNLGWVLSSIIHCYLHFP